MLETVKTTAQRLAIGPLGQRLAARQRRRTDVPLARWGLEVSPRGALARAGVDLVELVASYGSPLHVVWADALDANAAEALAPLSGAGPACDVFYSYKTNPVPGVLRRLHAAGIGAEVISPYELWLALRLRVPPERIIYNGPAKSFESLCDAVHAGVGLINANSLGDLDLIGRAAERAGRIATVGVRVTLPSMWGGQFGLVAASPAPAEAVRLAQRHAWLHLRGLHVHRGSGLRCRADMEDHVNGVLAFCDRLRTETGWHPEVIDLGGSLTTATVAPIPARQYRLNRALATDLLPPDPADHLSVGQASRLAAALVEAHSFARDLTAPAVVLEPGRALTGDAQLLLTTVHDVKEDGALAHAVLDAGVNIAEPATGEYHQIFSATAPTAPVGRSYRLVGPICTPADVICNNWRLPDLAPGHVLALMDSGAYFVPFSTSFSFPRPAIVLQDGAEVRLLRRAETFDDLVRADLMEGSGPNGPGGLSGFP